MTNREPTRQFTSSIVTVADSETRESQKRSGRSMDTVGQLCTHEEEDKDSEDSEH